MVVVAVVASGLGQARRYGHGGQDYTGREQLQFGH
jgi:hypothetical protein